MPVLGAVAIIALVTNIYFCITALNKELESVSFVKGAVANLVAIPGLVLLFVFAQMLFDFGW